LPPIDRDYLVKLYRKGKSAREIGEVWDISETSVYRLLDREGIRRRTLTEALNIRWANMTEEERINQTFKARHAPKRAISTEERVRWMTERATTLEANGVFTGAFELAIAGMVSNLQPTLQEAVGSYNIDIGIMPVAVEVHYSANSPLTDPQRRKKTEQLLKGGWWVLWIWVRRYHPELSITLGDEIEAMLDFARRNPSTIGKYRVIRSDRKPYSVHRLDGYEWADIPTSETLVD